MKRILLVIGYFCLYDLCLGQDSAGESPSPKPMPSLMPTTHQVAKINYIYEPLNAKLPPLPFPRDFYLKPKGTSSVPLFPASGPDGNVGRAGPIDGTRRPYRSYPGLPELESHSAIKGACFKPGELDFPLELRPKSGDRSEIRWIHEGAVLCSGPKCILPSKSWAMGLYQVDAIIYNNKGMLRVPFDLCIKRDPESEVYARGQELSPGVFDYLNYAEDLYARVRFRGRGFSLSDGQTQVLGGIPTFLKGDEILTSDQEAMLMFGRENEVQGALLPGSTIKLSRNAKFPHLVSLRSGKLRLRGLGEEAKKWGLIYGSSVFVEPGSEFDFIAEEIKGDERPLLDLKVLRGRIKVFYKRTAAKNAPWELANGPRRRYAESMSQLLDPKGTWTLIEIGPGMSLRLSKKQRSLAIPELPDAKSLIEVLKFTSPQYLVRADDPAVELRDPEKNALHLPGLYQTYLAKSSVKLDFSQVEKKVKDWWAQNEPLLALEYLLSLDPKPKDNGYRALLMKSYRLLGLSVQSSELELEDASEGPLMNLLAGFYPEAEEGFFKLINEPPKEKIPSLTKIEQKYYLALSLALQDKNKKALRGFRETLWLEGDDLIKEASEAWVQRYELERLWLMQLYTGGFYDSNVWALNPADELPEPLSLKGGMGGDLKFELARRYIPVQSGEAAIGLRGDFHGFKDYALGTASTATTELFNRWVLPLKRDKSRGVVNLRVEPAVRDKRVNQGWWVEYGGDLGLELKELLSAPELYLRYFQIRDLYPNTTSTFNPYNHEVEYAKERSFKLLELGSLLSPYKNADLELMALLFYRMEDQNAQSADALDRRSVALELGLKYHYLPWVQFHPTLNFEKISFPNQSRKDNALLFRLKADYFWWSDLSLTSTLEFKRVFSSDNPKDHYKALVSFGSLWVY